MTQDEEVRYAFAELNQTFCDELNTLMGKVDARARAEEREACARVCEDMDEVGCAWAIRARGQE